MAANFESGVTYGDVSWHKAETNLPADDPRRFSVSDTIIAAKMDWTVTKYPLQIANCHEVPEEIRGGGIADRYAVVRSSDLAVLGTVGSTYECLQNIDLFKWFQPFLDTKEASLETAGSLDGGRIVWVMARLAGDIAIDAKSNDMIRKYLLLSSSHNGLHANQVGFSPTRVVCQNTLSMAHRNGRLLKVRHTKRQAESLELVRDTINLANQTFEATAEQYRRMLEVRLSESELRSYVKLVLNAPDDDSAMSGRMKNQVRRCVQLAIAGKGQDGEKTVWHAYNGVTEFLSHHKNKDAQKRQKSLWFGQSATQNSRAFDLAMQLTA